MAYVLAGLNSLKLNAINFLYGVWWNRDVYETDTRRAIVMDNKEERFEP
jgi:hypothetical protein